MRLTDRIARIVALLSLVVVAACAAAPEDRIPEPDEVARLAASIRALGPEVDPEEAERAARVAYASTRELAQEYQITDPPLIHNSKVNMGLKPRGLCWHWAEDMEARLKREQFQTLSLHRAIANADNLRLEHSTAIISSRGDGYEDGIVLDPWRKGGVLFWSPTREDTRYDWKPRAQVMAEKRRRREQEEAYAN